MILLKVRKLLSKFELSLLLIMEKNLMKYMNHLEITF